MDYENYNHNKPHESGGGDSTPLVGNTPHSRNDHYHAKAMKAIRARGDEIGIRNIADSEDEMKKLLSILLQLDEDRAEILYEMFERAVSCHWKKIHNM
jgi:hypothetical protein